MNQKLLLSVLIVAIFILSACTQTQSLPETTEAPAETKQLPAPTEAPVIPTPTEPPAPQPTEFSTTSWSTTASTKSELSFAFPGYWDGSSPLTFGEGEFVKDPEQPIGVTFQIELAGSPETLLEAWGSEKVGVIGITTFTPESVTDGPDVTIARITTPTKIAVGEGITGQVTYIQRAEDVMEVMWFAPTDQWDDLQETFNGVLERIELWKVYHESTIGLQTMYVHDWQTPYPAWEDGSLMFVSEDQSTGLLVFTHNEIADPVEWLNEWSTDRLIGLELAECTLTEGDRMDTMSGQWESKTGECQNALGEQITYEVSFIPDKDRLLEMITFSPSEAWNENNAVAFKNLLGMMIDMRP